MRRLARLRMRSRLRAPLFIAIENMATLSAAVLCLIVGVSDGDTIKLRCGESAEETVRLLQIDAPEKKQAFGRQAKEALSNLAYGKLVELERSGTDRYGRTVGRVSLEGVDLNLEMVRQGFAWCYRKYLTDPTCISIEDGARQHRRGLWVEPEPVPPWDFRHPATITP